MKAHCSKVFILLFLFSMIGGCTSKKLENNIKSLEKRVAALEGKTGGGLVTTNTPASTSANTGSDTEFPVMTFESTEFDFGSVNEGDVVDYTFKFTNTGNFPLIINKATATCGCTVPQWPKEPILPGAKGVIQVKFNSKNRKNLQTKYVNINANTKPEITRLKITGNVIGADS